MSPGPVDVAQVRAAARVLLDAVAADRRYARTSHLQVRWVARSWSTST